MPEFSFVDWLKVAWVLKEKPKLGAWAPYAIGLEGGGKVIHLTVPKGFRITIRSNSDGSTEIVIEPIISA